MFILTIPVLVYSNDDIHHLLSLSLQLFQYLPCRMFTLYTSTSSQTSQHCLPQEFILITGMRFNENFFPSEIIKLSTWQILLSAPNKIFSIFPAFFPSCLSSLHKAAMTDHFFIFWLRKKNQLRLPALTLAITVT